MLYADIDRKEVKISNVSGILAELITIGLIIVDVVSPSCWCTRAVMRQCSASIDMTIDQRKARTCLLFRQQLQPYKVCECCSADYHAPTV